jgi:hypothetical protein
MIKGRWTFAALVASSTLVAAAAADAQPVRTININSLPAGAAVRVDAMSATPLGNTPLRRVRVPGGPHTLFFTLDGYVPGQIQVNIARNNETFTGTLTQAGSVYVSSDPDGATVTIDGNEVGTTPRRVNNLTPGQHIVEVRREGAQTFRETVTVGAGALATVNANMRPPEPQRPATGIVRVIVTNPNGALPADLVVSLDGSPLTGSPPASDTVTPGTHIVQVSANGFRTTRREVQITAGQTMALAVDLSPNAPTATGARVRVITSTPGAQAFLDGELLDGTPPQRENVAAGTHVLRVTAPGRVAQTREVTVVAGQAELNLNVDELAAAPQTGRLRVVTSTPGAQISIDGEAATGSPVDRGDVRFGEHVIRIRAPGFEDFEQRCNLTAERACEVVDPTMRAAQQLATLSVRLTNPVPGATMQVNTNPPQPIGDIGNLPVGSVQITVTAPGHATDTRSMVLQPGGNALSLTLPRIGPSRSDVARRRAAISTFGAAPLTRGDGAVDFIASYGGLPAEFRATLGFMPHGLFAVDGGLGIRILGVWNEFELRSRFGLRLLEDVLAVGGELRVYGAFGTEGRRGVGVTGQLNVSFNFSLASDEEAAGETDPNAAARARANRPGSFSITLNGGFEHNSDTAGEYNPTLTQNSRLFDLCANARTRDEVRTRNAMAGAGAMQEVVPVCDAGTSTRGFLGLNVEFGLSRHVNLFAGMQFFPADFTRFPTAATEYAPNDAVRRWVTTDLWGALSPINIRLGLTYKF